jgi:hypothetical protein
MAPEVVEAMAAASRGSVDIGELQDAASARIAEATGAEAGLVTTGAAAALTLAAAASIARWDVAKMAALPHVVPADILLPRTHRTGYAHALAASGARLVDIGHNDRGTGRGRARARGLGDRGGAVARRSWPSASRSMPRASSTCRRSPRSAGAGLPLIVDAAAQLPPKENLRRFIAMGADLVAFSGGKALGGPQASGILAGRRDLVASALLQQLDMDVRPRPGRRPAGRPRQPARRAASRHRPRLQGGQGGDRRPADRARSLREGRRCRRPIARSRRGCRRSLRRSTATTSRSCRPRRPGGAGARDRRARRPGAERPPAARRSAGPPVGAPRRARRADPRSAGAAAGARRAAGGLRAHPDALLRAGGQCADVWRRAMP